MLQREYKLNDLDLDTLSSTMDEGQRVVNGRGLGGPDLLVLTVHG
jgi:hypothetical protein